MVARGNKRKSADLYRSVLKLIFDQGYHHAFLSFNEFWDQQAVDADKKMGAKNWWRWAWLTEKDDLATFSF